MHTATKKLYGAKEEGCWFDGSRGIYLGKAIIQEAIGHGFETTEGFTPDDKWYHEVWDEAVDYLQQFAAPGYWFGQSEQGDFGLWACEEEG